ncbi:MAG: V-type ATPase subunit [Thermoplasmataceae archaeon]
MEISFAGSYGRSRLIKTELLSNEYLYRISEAPNFEEIIRILNETSFKKDIVDLFNSYEGKALVEIASNRRMIELIVRLAEGTPPSARTFISAYLSRWDIESIKSLLTAKFLNRSITESDIFLVNSKNIPIGVRTSLLTKEDYNIMSEEGDIESISKYLLKMGYGAQIMKNMEEFRKTGDLSILLYSLDIMQYERLMDSLKFFRGDEGVIMRYFRAKIDERNIMILMKGNSLKMSFDLLLPGLLAYGNIRISRLEEFFGQLKSNDDHVKMIDDLLSINIDQDINSKTGVTALEQKIQGSILRNYIQLLSTQSNSLGSIFSVMLRAENERDNIRKIINGKAYGFEPSRIRDMLIMV